MQKVLYMIGILLCASVCEGSNLRERFEESERPKIYTFYSRASKANPRLPYENEMILLAWKASWHSKGWDPIVLSLEDAKLHYRYGKFEEAFETADPQISLYDRYCFYRWLAVSARGGGWMADFDSFPLNIDPNMYGRTLPNEGKFTSYDGHIPHLVSGTSEEFDRMIDLLYDSFQKNSYKFWSDMLALLDIHSNNNDSFLYLSETTSPRKIYYSELQEGKVIENPFDLSIKCPLLVGVIAIHFSHADCDHVRWCDYKRHMAYDWVKIWEEKCLDKKFYYS